MSIIKRKRDGTVQIYLRLTQKQLYLGIEDKINPDRAYKALSYLWDKITARHEKDLAYYERVGRMLESLLPEEERRRLQEAVSQEDMTILLFLIKTSNRWFIGGVKSIRVLSPEQDYKTIPRREYVLASV